MTRSQIAGLGHYAPERIVPNGEIEHQLELEAGWIKRRTGIIERRWAADNEALSDLAINAADMALDQAALDRSSVALTLLATSTPDHLLPPTAPLVAHKLGLENSGGIDLAGACAGFLYALTLADAHVRAHQKPVLVIAANILSRRINMKERASAILFADAAGAVVLAPTDRKNAGLRTTQFIAHGADYSLINIPAGGSRKPYTADLDIDETLMTITDGRAVFIKAVDLMARTSLQALADAGRTINDIDHWIPHQANARIMEATRKKLNIEPAKTCSTVAHYANSSAATIPFTLSMTATDRAMKPGDTLLFCAAGAGLNGGAIVWEF